MKKRGLSSVVTTVIIIAITLVAIFIVWAIVSSVMDKSARQISLSRITVSTQLDSANVNFSSGIATIRVTRNAGQGNVTGIKIMVDDGKTVEVFEKRFTMFNEGASKTVTINLSESSDLILYNINKISIAPIILLESGEEVIGIQSKPIGGLNKLLSQTIDTEAQAECLLDSQCEASHWVAGTAFCSQDTTQVLQYYQTFKCLIGTCTSSSELLIQMTCSTGTYCYGEGCIVQPVACSPATVNQTCGPSGFIGSPICNGDKSAIVQDYRTRSCVNSSCSEGIITQTLETCPQGEVCGTTPAGANCYIPLECASNSDCDLGEVCKEGKCVPEAVMNNGTISSIWPFFVGEYFDSPSLPKSIEDYKDRYIIFPGSQETRCMKVVEHVYPNKTGASAYVRLNESTTNISSGNSYEIWETSYSCTLV